MKKATARPSARPGKTKKRERPPVREAQLPDMSPYGRLAEHFEHYAGALDYTRRVHFYGHPEHPFFRFSLG